MRYLLLSRSHQEWWSAARAAHRINLLHQARSRVSLVIRSVLTDVHFVMLLLYDVFGLSRLRFPLTFHESYTSPARTLRLWWCVQRRRVCDVQKILEAVWWCQAPWGCCRLFYVQSNWLVTSDDKSTVLLIGSCSHQLLWESRLLRHRWELSTPANILVSFSDLWWFLCLSISEQDRAFFSWPVHFGIWCLYYNCRQLISVSRDIWNVQPPQCVHHPL